MEILESEISDLRMEIADTDRRGYREMLKNHGDSDEEHPTEAGTGGDRKDRPFKPCQADYADTCSITLSRLHLRSFMSTQPIGLEEYSRFGTASFRRDE